MSLNRIIFYADDDTDDRNWVQEACKAVDERIELRFFGNGHEVLQLLEASEPSALPSLIVLDLNMPKLDGRQTLKAIKDHERYRNVPVAIVTTSSSTLDREICTKFGADLFLTKPSAYEEWREVVRDFSPLLKLD